MSRSSKGQAYFEFLADQVGRQVNWDLLSALHSFEFVWLVPNDDNRVLDAIEIRDEFDPTVMDGLGASCLEILVSLSRRLAFNGEGSPDVWARELLENLGLHRLRSNREIGVAIETLIWRQYEYSGQGGFFPLIDAQEDQRKVELWYQMSAYLEDRTPDE